MAGQGGLDGDLRRFVVANFADQDHVRVMPQNRTQPAGESQPGLFRNLDLVEAFELIFDRVFNGNDLADGIVDLTERRVESRGLSATRGTGYQDDAVRQAEHAPERLKLPGIQTQFAHAAQRGVLPQQPHDHRFAVEHWDDGDANVHLIFFQADFVATILRQPFLRDVEVAQDFHPGDDG